MISFELRLEKWHEKPRSRCGFGGGAEPISFSGRIIDKSYRFGYRHSFLKETAVIFRKIGFSQFSFADIKREMASFLCHIWQLP